MNPSSPFAKQLVAANPMATNGQLTEADVRKALPTNMASAVTPHLVTTLNNLASDPITTEYIQKSFISYTAILKEGKYKIEDYINAVSYVTYKIMGYNNEESYFRTFPARHAKLVAQGASKKDISAYVSAYHKGKLVNTIMEQAIIPTWIVNHDAFQRAINVQVELMTDPDISPKVRTDAANSLLNHLKKPENHTFQINMDVAESSGMKEMKAMLNQLAQQQHDAIHSGKMKTVDVASSRIELEDE